MKDVNSLRERSDQLQRELEMAVDNYLADIGDGFYPIININFIDVTTKESDVKQFATSVSILELKFEMNI